MSRTLDRQCALAMGDVQIEHEWHSLSGLTYSDRDGGPLHYSTDHAAARLLEDAIFLRNLQHEYSVILTNIVSESWLLYGWRSWEDSWALIRATPEQRARAFLQAVA